jgi:hypothetical protein
MTVSGDFAVKFTEKVEFAPKLVPIAFSWARLLVRRPTLANSNGPTVMRGSLSFSCRTVTLQVVFRL